MTATHWRTALVTGASSGIGEGFARRLAAGGTDLVVVARRTDRLEALATELHEAHGVDVEVLTADLADPWPRAAVEARLADAGRPIDLLVNNAGFGTSGPFVELDVDREDEEIRLNVIALVRLTHAALPGMIERGRGAVCNVSSVASFQPLPQNATYAATKAFVTSFSQALHEETRGTGVTVTALCPGFVQTEFQQHSDTATSRVPSFAWLDVDHVVDAGLAATARGRAVAVPGATYKALDALAQVTPRGLVRRIAGAVTDRAR